MFTLTCHAELIFSHPLTAYHGQGVGEPGAHPERLQGIKLEYILCGVPFQTKTQSCYPVHVDTN